MVVPRFVQAALSGQPLQVHGDGSQSRCFCDVRDVVRVLPTLLGQSSCHGKIFNVGSDQPISIRALAESVIRVTNSASTIHTIPYAQAFGPSAGFEDLRHRRPSLERIRNATGFAAQIPLDVTIRDVASFLQSCAPGTMNRSPAKAGVP
jgi:UDP-glucose 4-epimerase